MTDYRTAPIEDVIQAAKKVALELAYYGDDAADLITRLVEELRDARRDTARLDWIENHATEAEILQDVKRRSMAGGLVVWHYKHSSDSLREALDAAMIWEERA